MTLLVLAISLGAEMSAEFYGRTVPVKNEHGEMKAVASEHHLVVEVTVKAAKGEPVKVSHQQFRLRVNGAKQAIAPDPAGLAAAPIYYPDWHQTRGVEAQAGPVIVGRPQRQPRFPGDPSTREDRSGEDKGQTLTAAMTQASLGEGELFSERTGLLYFPWKGRVAKIKTLELVWTLADGREVVAKLR